MPTRRDNAAERAARIEWLLEETRTQTETVAADVETIRNRTRKASQLARANLHAAKRRRASKP